MLMKPEDRLKTDATAVIAAGDGGGEPIAASEILLDMLRHLPPDHFTLRWLSSHLHRRSFGVIVLVLALIAMVPGISYAAGLLLISPAIEMIVGRATPTFPKRIADRPFPTRRLAAVVTRTVPILRQLEKAVGPRWGVPMGVTKRLVGVAVLLLTALLLLTPLPLIQVVPGFIIVILSIAYLEDDGLLLTAGLFATLVLAAASAGAVWGMVLSIGMIRG